TRRSFEKHLALLAWDSLAACSRIGRVRRRSYRRKRRSEAPRSSEIHVLWRSMTESGVRVSNVAPTFESVEQLDAELSRMARGAGALRLGLADGLEALARLDGHHEMGFARWRRMRSSVVSGRRGGCRSRAGFRDGCARCRRCVRRSGEGRWASA